MPLPSIQNERGENMSSTEISTEEYYVASIDLLGMKNIIVSDIEGENLKSIRNIYKSWVRIFKDDYFANIKIRFFSDNVVIAIPTRYPNGADRLLEKLGWLCGHLLKCGYKPRGAVTKGAFYIDDIFVWGSALVDAYLLESKKAIYPRILIDEKVAVDASKHLSECLIFCDKEDGKRCLNYLRAFGGNATVWVSEISLSLEYINNEISDLEKSNENGDNNKVLRKLYWLKRYEEENLQFWKNR